MSDIEALAAALEEVYGGDQMLEASALADQIEDRGFRLVTTRSLLHDEVPFWWVLLVVAAACLGALIAGAVS